MKENRVWTIAATVVLAVIVGVDELVLSGEVVLSSQLTENSPVTETLKIERIDEEHTVSIRPRNRDGAQLGIVLRDPSGNTVDEVDESVRHKRRYITFTPRVAGDYALTLERQDVLIGNGSVSGRVKVYVGDRRIFTPFFYSLGG